MMSSNLLRWTVALCCLALLSSAAAHTSSELPPVLARQPASAPEAAPSNHTNETPTNNSTYVPPPTLTPTQQNVSGRWNEPATFEVVVGNPANASSRVVYLSGRAPAGWTFSLDTANVTLAPGESATVQGTVRMQAPLLGGEGTLVLRATASDRTVTAYVNVCFEGLLVSCGANSTDAASPHAVRTHAVGSQNPPAPAARAPAVELDARVRDPEVALLLRI